ncbi:DUF6817 domain-containing protein [Actinoplanes sp. NPDC051411]|uniref:DUF6817 domain-containing protein n=1 Tax=Actinoplanes sp. NPDC051411 TaxID=3155522 RepID=UPI0034390F6B
MAIDDAARAFLVEHGADAIEHPGGTLFAHLLRVRERLGSLGAPAFVQLAGLTHAAYGTDGFDRVLISWTRRDLLRAVIGEEAEELVYLYGACDRDRTWPELVTARTVADRFTGRELMLEPGLAVPFVELTIVNELDVMDHNPAILSRHGEYFRELFARWEPLISPGLAEQIRHSVAG